MKKLTQMCLCNTKEEDERLVSMETILKKLNKRLKYDRSDVFVLLVRIYTRHVERKEFGEACFLIRELARICEIENIDRYVSTILARDILARGLDVVDPEVTVVKEEEATVVEKTNVSAKDEKPTAGEDDIQFRNLALP